MSHKNLFYYLYILRGHITTLRTKGHLSEYNASSWKWLRALCTTVSQRSQSSPSLHALPSQSPISMVVWMDKCSEDKKTFIQPHKHPAIWLSTVWHLPLTRSFHRQPDCLASDPREVSRLLSHKMVHITPNSTKQKNWVQLNFSIKYHE